MTRIEIEPLDVSGDRDGQWSTTWQERLDRIELLLAEVLRRLPSWT
jgi:hypothetical protein